MAYFHLDITAIFEIIFTFHRWTILGSDNVITCYSATARICMRVPMCGGFVPYNFTFICQYACVSFMSHFACVRSLCGGRRGGGGGGVMRV